MDIVADNSPEGISDHDYGNVGNSSNNSIYCTEKGGTWILCEEACVRET